MAFFVAAAAGLVLVVLVAIVVIVRDDQLQAPRIRGVEAVAGAVHMVPDLPRSKHGIVKDVMSKVLERLYERAFITSLPVATETPRATPSVVSRIDDLFTPDARAALRSDPGVFSTPGLIVDRGRVTYEGLVTTDGGRGEEAFFEIVFEAVATPEGATAPTVAIRQRGTLILVHAAEGWKVRAFDLRFSSSPVASPSPSPSS